MADGDKLQTLLTQILVPEMDLLVQSAILRTPELTERDIANLQKRRIEVLRYLSLLFPPSALEEFVLWSKRANLIVLLVCIMSACLVLRSGPGQITIIGQVLLACVVGVLGAWCIYFISIIFKPIAFFLSAALGVATFIGIFSWWASPLSPVKAKPHVTARIEATSSTKDPAFGARITGEALLPPRTHLWTYVESNNSWRPLQEISVDPRGHWQIRVHPEDLRYLSCNIRFAVIALNQTDHQKVQRELQSSSNREPIPAQSIPEQALVQQSFSIRIANCNPNPLAKPGGRARAIAPNQKVYPWPGQLIMSFAFLRPVEDPNEKLKWMRQVEESSSLIAARSDDSEAYKTRGYALSLLGNQEQAERDFAKSIQLAPSIAGYNGHGLVLMKMGRLDEAIKEFKTATEHPLPTDTDNMIAAAENLHKAENIDSNLEDIIGYLNAVANYRPSDGELWFRLAKAYEEQGKFDLARTSLTKATSSDVPEIKEKASSELKLLNVSNK